jgi:MFS family permease
MRTVTKNAWPLYLAAFAMSAALGIWWTAMPFILRNIGGTEEHVGYAPAANMFGYMCGLFVMGSLLHHVNPRQASRSAAAIISLAVLVICVGIYLAGRSDHIARTTWIWIIIGSAAAAGIAMAFFWPFLMSWVSAGYEGLVLNQRLGYFNGAWSGAGSIGPLIGAVLVGISSVLPMAVTAGCLLLCFVMLGRAQNETVNQIGVTNNINSPAANYPRHLLTRLRWMARIALFSSWACFAIYRSQFALLFTNLGFSESQFGIIMTAFSVFNFIIFIGAGRSAFWHYKPLLLIAAQALLILSLFAIIYGRGFWIFFLSFIVLALGFSFAYSSHLYYGASGGKKLSARMAVHEITIALGVSIGSAAGGYLAKNISPYSPYWFALVVFAVGLIAQLLILLSAQIMSVRK